MQTYEKKYYLHKNTTTTTSSRLRDCSESLTKQWTRLKERLTWSPRLEFPAWRWAKNFEWLSRTHYEGRTVILRNKHKRKILERLSIDLDKNQIKFQPNKYKSAKYTILTFPVLNLFEQFRRAANFYFLISLILTLAIDSPISPISWLFSLLFVVLVTMIKQGYEDYLRHLDDRRNNRRKVTVIKKGKETIVNSEHVTVGDIIQLRENEPVPCDMVIISSSHDKGQCYVETSNLDGETSLKTKLSPSLTKYAQTIKQVCSLFGCVECENPNPKLDTFLGRLTIWTCEDSDEPTVCPLSNENLLLSGTYLKNTREVFGCCVYTGNQTKISLNSKITKNKFSTIEKSLNRYLLFLVGILVTQIVSATILCFAFDYEFHKGSDLYLFSLGKVLHFFGAEKETYLNITNINRAEHRRNIQSLLGYSGTKDYPRTTFVQNSVVWYLDQVDDITFVRILEVMLLWMVTFNYIIPLSLYVSLELQKFVASVQFTWDRDMYDEETDEPAQCHTSDINEELGLVTHLLTDKTGTITKNEMVLARLWKDGSTFHTDRSFPQAWDPFTMVLTLCHSVQVTGGEFVASSPDEKAILEACRNNGFVFNGEFLDGRVEVTANHTRHTLDKLAELPFDSFRKCMTVILRDREGIIHVLSKGAETTMLNICSSGDLESVTEEIDCMADMGLRTLALGHKTITQEQLDGFEEALESANKSIVNRAKFVREVYQDIEQGLHLLGATGIEDKLQDEVVGTICDMKRAGIKVWMLTGDKKETAMNLGHSAGILRLDSNLIDLCDNADPRDVTTLVSEIMEGNDTDKSSRDELSLIIDGKSLATLFKAPETTKQLEKLSSQCDTVIACRLSPIQKSQLVRLVKDADSNNLTAAIGDGGNDISMLQEAHVGIGIIGKEGRAASQASDFAFCKFRCLRKALLVHGHWYYVRAAFLVQYSFYKNIAFCTGQVYYMFFSNYSAQTLFESTYLFLFNTVYTFVPVIIYSTLEQNLPARELLRMPEQYSTNFHNSRMSRASIARWFCLAVWHSFVAFFGWYFLIQVTTPSDTDLFYFQSVISQCCVIIINLKVLIESRYWTWPLVLSVLLSILSYFFLTLLYHSVGPFNNFALDNYDVFYTYTTALSDPMVWLTTMLLVLLGLLPDFLFHVGFQLKPRGEKPRFNQTQPYIQTVV